MLPRLDSKLVTNWIIVTLAASIGALLYAPIQYWAALQPSRVFHGELWRLFTWPFVETGPITLVITCLSIYKFGGELVVRWGERRLQRFMAQVLLAAGVVTCLLAMIAGAQYLRRFGGFAVMNVLVIAWARQFPERKMLVYNLVAFSGQRLVNVTCGIVIVLAIATSPVWMAPELSACAFAALYPRSLLRR